VELVNNNCHCDYESIPKHLNNEALSLIAGKWKVICNSRIETIVRISVSPSPIKFNPAVLLDICI